jgi:hypothetical protein
MDNPELHMLGDFSPMHDIGHAVVDSFVDETKNFIHDNPKTSAALAGAAGLAGAAALAPEMSVAGLAAGGLAGLEAMGLNTGLAGAMGVIM